MIGDDLPVWNTDDAILVCRRFIEYRPGEFLAMGQVCDPATALPTGLLFALIESHGEVKHVWQAPPIVWERWLSMIHEVLEQDI